ncbi:MAG: hypothetical protein Hyperionvirus27_11 [Hyperionvirus sp.]|uniref:Uncharacterized protein n=1 Tax=Hyperionvirus sp. TaxID=2487770 RepID=A0A3G5ADZ2_9VIRU|nr:MAG: hypothetical protein Hyperionvirus27_11 [Hyperionvirus sp.]
MGAVFWITSIVRLSDGTLIGAWEIREGGIRLSK